MNDTTLYVIIMASLVLLPLLARAARVAIGLHRSRKEIAELLSESDREWVQMAASRGYGLEEFKAYVRTHGVYPPPKPYSPLGGLS